MIRGWRVREVRERSLGGDFADDFPARVGLNFSGDADSFPAEGFLWPNGLASAHSEVGNVAFFKDLVLGRKAV